MKPATLYQRLLVCLAYCIVCGCGGEDAPPATTATDSVPTGSLAVNVPEGQSVDQVIELNAENLLAMRLPDQQAADGWVRLFDGHTMYGWLMAGDANWLIKDRCLIVDAGDKSLLCTTLPWKDYELSIEFRAGAKTNSGIFLRTPMMPEDPVTDCYELNIAPRDNAFPTASLVGRHKAEPSTVGEIDPEQWHHFLVRVDGDTVTVTLDDKELYTYSDPNPLPANHIGLQHNSGRVEFREVMVRPLGMESLLPGDREPSETIAGWKQYPDMSGSFSLNDEGNLHVRGGKTQLESEQQYADFAMLVQAKTAGPKQNSGIFFRCIPGEEMNGYECQINNDAVDGNPLLPADCGTGGFFRRQDARIIAAGNDQWFSMLLVVHGPNMAAWVNGLQVSEWQDTREPDPNPRRGKRLEAGTIMLQGHDEATDVLIKEIKIAPGV